MVTNADDDDNEFIRSFKIFSKELDTKNDKYERILKTSRDITIESKRLIFALLGRIKYDDYNKTSEKIDNDITKIMSLFKKITIELENEEPSQFIGAYSAGLEEFIEGLTLYKFMTTSNLFNFEDLRLMFKTELNLSDEKTCYFVPLIQYFLGVEDLSGELMRLAINSLTANKKSIAVKATNFVKQIYRGLLQISCWNRVFPKKLYVLKQSLLKMEHAIYTVNIRGSEMPSHMLESIISSNDSDEHIFGTMGT